MHNLIKMQVFFCIFLLKPCIIQKKVVTLRADYNAHYKMRKNVL